MKKRYVTSVRYSTRTIMNLFQVPTVPYVQCFLIRTDYWEYWEYWEYWQIRKTYIEGLVLRMKNEKAFFDIIFRNAQVFGNGTHETHFTSRHDTTAVPQLGDERSAPPPFMIIDLLLLDFTI